MTIDFRVSAKFKGFWYLASPYTHFPEGREAAYTLAVDTTAALLRAGVPVFSPIVHTHPPAVAGDLQQASHEFWVGVDQPMMDAAGGIVVLFAPSWEKSRGMAQEIETFKAARKPVVWMRPGVIPRMLLPTAAR